MPSPSSLTRRQRARSVAPPTRAPWSPSVTRSRVDQVLEDDGEFRRDRRRRILQTGTDAGPQCHLAPRGLQLQRVEGPPQHLFGIDCQIGPSVLVLLDATRSGGSSTRRRMRSACSAMICRERAPRAAVSSRAGPRRSRWRQAGDHLQPVACVGLEMARTCARPGGARSCRAARLGASEPSAAKRAAGARRMRHDIEARRAGQPELDHRLRAVAMPSRHEVSKDLSIHRSDTNNQWNGQPDSWLRSEPIEVMIDMIMIVDGSVEIVETTLLPCCCCFFLLEVSCRSTRRSLFLGMAMDRPALVRQLADKRAPRAISYVQNDRPIPMTAMATRVGRPASLLSDR